jgi:hypothetical protein
MFCLEASWLWYNWTFFIAHRYTGEENKVVPSFGRRALGIGECTGRKCCSPCTVTEY